MTDLEAKASDTIDRLMDTVERVYGDTGGWKDIIATALRDARNAALEEAAGVVERVSFSSNRDYDCERIAARIRSLKGDSPDTTPSGSP